MEDLRQIKSELKGLQMSGKPRASTNTDQYGEQQTPAFAMPRLSNNQEQILTEVIDTGRSSIGSESKAKPHQWLDNLSQAVRTRLQRARQLCG